ncbi:MAG TPA: hypothetical protein VIT91_21820 [Chthoniobacterales bacterium]
MKRFILATSFILLAIFGFQAESKGQVGFSITVGNPGYYRGYYYDDCGYRPYYRTYYRSGYYGPVWGYRRVYRDYDRPRYRYWRDGGYRRYDRRQHRHHRDRD